MWLTKAETWALADHHNKLDVVRDHTLTCYNGIKGFGCSNCDACTLRARGLTNFLENKLGTIKTLKSKINLE
jgi:7-cyano-7-deazaguanine synthase